MPDAAARLAEESAKLRSQFEERAGATRQLLVDLMIELRWGKAASAWTGPALTAVRELATLADKLDEPPSKQPLTDFIGQLEKAKRANGSLIAKDSAEELLGTGAAVLEALGKPADLETEHELRDASLVDALLLQTEGVHAPTLDKLYKAGFCSSESLVKVQAAELAHQTGVELSLAERILSEVRSFRAEFPGAAPEPTRARERRRLQSLLEELRSQQERFERASRGWSDSDLHARRGLRSERARTVLRMHAILAHLGEVERIQKIERLPYAQKLGEFTTFLGADQRSASSLG